MNEETFELELLGGVAESRYRSWRPEVTALPWTDLSGLARDDSERIAAMRSWTSSSLQEYATAAAHAFTVSLLVQVRAPLDLSALASRFPLDELTHAELFARMANAVGGGAPVTYRPAELFPRPTIPEGGALLVLAERVVRDCCVSETLATSLLRLISQGSGPPLLHQVVRIVVRDEAIHGRFGWLFLDWALPRLSPSDLQVLARAAGDEIAKHEANWETLSKAPAETFSPLGIFGGVSVGAYVRCGERVLESRLLPRLTQLGLRPA